MEFGGTLRDRLVNIPTGPPDGGWSEGLKTTFTRGANRTDRGHEEEITRLQTKIGELVVERNFLAKAFDR